MIDGRVSAWGLPIIDMHCHFPVPDLPDLVVEAHRSQSGDAKADLVAADSRWYQEQWWTARGFAFPEESEPPADVQAERWDAEIEASRIDAAVFLTGGGNDTLAVAIAGRERMYGFAHHDPFEPGAADELRRAVSELGFVGYKIIAPALLGAIDDPALTPVWDAAEDLGIPVLIHFGPNGGGGGTAWHENINPLRLHAVAKGYPEVPFIVPHFGCGWPRELLHLMWACRNVHVDTSGNNEWIRWMPDRFTLTDYFRKFFETVGPTRILFGSDSAWFPRGLARAYFDEQTRIVGELGWSDADRDLVFHGNAARLLRLS
ncbi:MAG: amidohydrolase family protein [Microbacterium sp.]